MPFPRAPRPNRKESGLERRPHRVVIIGGGFGGLRAARSLRRAPVDVTLIDRRNFHLFQPLLYQVATGGLSPANIAAPLRAVLKRQPNTRVMLGEVVDIDVGRHRVTLQNGAVEYDTLIVAAGCHHDYFGHDSWESLAPGLKTIEDATEIRGRVLRAFEEAERRNDPAAVPAWLTFVVVGGGPTGVEIAGSLAELAQHTLNRNFRNIDPAAARIELVEAGERVLPTYPPGLSVKAARALTRLGVVVRTGSLVTDLRPDGVTIRCSGVEERLVCRTVLWAAGTRASRLGRRLAAATGAEVDGTGRLSVGPDLCLPGHPEILVIGDLARVCRPTGEPLPGVAPVAVQQGRFAARLVRRRLRGGRLPPFRYRDHGSMATIGRARAVVDLGWLHFSGYPAWLIWLFVHLMSLVEFENRVLVLIQWAWNYVTRNRAARLITNRNR